MPIFYFFLTAKIREVFLKILTVGFVLRFLTRSKYPRLHKAVVEYMLHGPCGPDKLKSPCMENRKCTKKFPKSFNESTSIDENGFPVYRRRDNGVTVEKGGSVFDNGWVVPYNPYLLLRYEAHINIEFCNQSRAIKYLFKYINKGSDRICLALKQMR